MNLITDICNQALDAAGVDFTLGDIEEGTREAQVCLRAYQQCLMQLLRSAHWDFARKQAPLTLLADATGQTANVGTIVPQPWIYEYEYPTDCMKARFVPLNNFQQTTTIPSGNIAVPSTPPVTGLGQPPINQNRLIPGRFLVATDFNYPPPLGQITWEVQGVSPEGRTVILTNVQNAMLIYTSLVKYPSVWDPLFRAALVAFLACEIALPLSKDKKFGMAMRGQNMNIAKEKIQQARVTDGNEGFYSSDIAVDWLRIRSSGGWIGTGAPGFGAITGPGVLGYGWDACSMGGSAF